MALKKVEERNKAMLTLLNGWKGLEDDTINSCSKILKNTKNPIVSTLITAIRNDSEKHKTIIQLLIDSMTKKAFVLVPADLIGLSSLLEKHIQIEQKSINTAKKAIEMSRDAIVKQLLKLILEDEKNHKKLTAQINELKFRVTARTT